MTLVEMVNQIVGDVPPGWEFMPYVVACVLFVVAVVLVAKLLYMPLRKILRGWF